MTIRTCRQRGTDEYCRILCLTDFSSLADEGLDRAARLAARDRAELVLVHVLPPASAYAVPEMAGSVLIRFADQWREDAWRTLCRIRDRIRQTGVVTHAILREGYPPDQIVRVAGRLRCDLIVLATRGRTGFLHRLLGSSVAEGVMRRAPCPILAYRSPQSSPTHGRVKNPWKVAA
jgi:universal stress protein A